MAREQGIDTSVGPIGGQALLEGVMMRRGQSWGAAVRCQDGTITTTSRTLPEHLDRWRKIPILRGILALGETAVLGTKATIWAATERGDESGDGYTRRGLAITVIVAVVGVFGIFGLMPAIVGKAVLDAAGVDSALALSVIEGVLRLAILVGYLWALSRNAQVKRVFAYHGAEHMTIHAFEHRISLTAEHIRAFDRRHPRCGTAFLLVVVMTTVFVHALIGHPESWALLMVSRILALPVVAGVAYEAIRFAGRHQHQWAGKVLMAPGYWLQNITTEDPTDDMIEVAVAALEATLAAEPLAPAPAPADAATDPSLAGAAR